MIRKNSLTKLKRDTTRGGDTGRTNDPASGPSKIIYQNLLLLDSVRLIDGKLASHNEFEQTMKMFGLFEETDDGPILPEVMAELEDIVDFGGYGLTDV